VTATPANQPPHPGHPAPKIRSILKGHPAGDGLGADDQGLQSTGNQRLNKQGPHQPRVFAQGVPRRNPGPVLPLEHQLEVLIMMPVQAHGPIAKDNVPPAP